MKRVLSLIPILILSLAICGSALAQKSEKREKPRAAMVEPSGSAVWNYLTKADYAKKRKMWPGKSAFYPGTEPNGALLTTYM